MARQRDTKAEYARRVASGRARGLSRQEARGHGPTGAPEHPERLYRPGEAEKRPRYLQRLNDRRAAENKAPLDFGGPPEPRPGHHQFTYDTLEDAERHTAGVPNPYRRIYITREGFVAVIERQEHRSRRRAA